MCASLSSLKPLYKAKEIPMSEKVLAVPRPAIEAMLQQGFFEANGTDLMGRLGELAIFLDRSAAENDPTHKQIIPYILIVHQGRFLLYKRTKKQGESRLHEKFSLGFGGHINDIDGNKDTDTNLILAAMIRELNEELFLPSVRQLRVAGFINDDTNAVGKVHLGIAFIVEAANERFAINEPEMIEAKWCDAQAVEDIFPKLESWSQLLWTQYAKIQLCTPTVPDARLPVAV
jgi:predicted NUDIX family phosphoesterase